MARIYLTTNNIEWGMFLDIAETSQSIANNNTTVTANLYLYRTRSASYYGGNYSYSITVNGETKSNNAVASYPTNISAGEGYANHLGGFTYTVGHNTDGTKKINVSASFSAYFSPSSASGSGEVTLTTIPRYASVSHNIGSKTVDTVTINWSSDSTCDYLWYSSDGGSSWSGIDISDGKSGSYTIKYLSPNTKYSIRTKIRRKDSQLETTASRALSVTTNNIAYVTSANDFNDEENPTLSFVNNSGGNISIHLEFSVTSPMYSRSIGRYNISTSGSGSYTVVLTDTERKELRQENLKNGNNKLTIRYVVATPSPSGRTNYSNFVDKTMTVINADPDFSNFEWETLNYNDLTGDHGQQTVIKNYSTIRTTISPSNKAIAKKEASITSYQTNIGTKSKKYNNPTTYPLYYDIPNVDGATIEVYANDNRGNFNIVRKPIANYIEYSPLTGSGLNVIRTEQINSETRLTFNGTVDLVDFGAVKNEILEAKYYYKEADSDEDFSAGHSGVLSPSLSQYSETVYRFSIDELIKGDLGTEGFDVDKSFVIKVVIRDNLSTISEEFILGSGSPAAAIYKNNIALGGRYDEGLGGRVQLNYDSYFGTKHISEIDMFKNLLNIDNFKYDYGYIAFDLSYLEIGKTYTFSSNKPIVSFKISNAPSGHSSIEKNDENGFTIFTFVMSRHPNIAAESKQYLYLSTTGLWEFVESLSELNGYDLQIEPGDTATRFNPFVAAFTKNGMCVNEDICSVNGDLRSQNGNLYLANGRFISGWGTVYSDPGTSFQTTLFGSNASNFRIAAVRPSSTNYSGFAGTYAASLAWTASDTHGLLSTNYNSRHVKISGGNQDSIKWTGTVMFEEDFSNAVVYDTGSNSNGSYIRFTNGIMFCWGWRGFTKDCTKAWGSLYETESFSLGSFPVSFVDTPTSVQLTVTPDSTYSLHGFVEGPASITKNTIGSTFFCRPVSVTGAPFKISYIAMGKWK